MNPNNERVTEADFIIAPNDFSCLLGPKTLQEMGLFTINDVNFKVQVSTDASLQESWLKQNCILTQMSHQEHYLITQKLDRLVKFKVGVLVPVEEPTAWVSQMAVLKKPVGSVRICIDSPPMYEALQREHYTSCQN